MMHINSLPLETLVEILLKIDGNTLGGCRRVCKRWKECIQQFDQIWQQMCWNEFRYSSQIAKRKSGNSCQWYHIYKNLKLWSKNSIQNPFCEFYKFNTHDKTHALDIEYSILPLRDTRGIVLYDANTLKYIPTVIPERNCIKVSNTENVTVVLLKSGLLLQRTLSNVNHMAEAFFEAENFVLCENALYFYYKRNVFSCNLLSDNLVSKSIFKCDFDIKQIQYNNGLVYIFTHCGKIITIGGKNKVEIKPINCPVEWIKQIKHICAIDDKNFVCYSRNLFIIETDKYKHLYLDFPQITALFFYGDIVLIGTKVGEILLYRLTSQKHATKPIFEKITELPDGKFALKLDICERKTGPVIVAATFLELFILEVDFFPLEQTDVSRGSFSTNNLSIYKRLLRIKDRIHMY